MDELDKQIKELEEAWEVYHKQGGKCIICNLFHVDVNDGKDEYDHELKTYDMPDMMQLAKLRAQRDRLKRSE